MSDIPRIQATAAFPRASVPVLSFREGELRPVFREAICECALRIVANGRALVNLLCSHAALRELAYGFLLSEGVVGSLADVRACELDEVGMTASFELAVPVRLPACPTVSSGFGGKVLRSPLGAPRRGFDDADELAGKRGVGPAACAPTWMGTVRQAPAGGGARSASAAISGIMDSLNTMAVHAPEHAATRGMHCSALFRGGELLGCFEDIGRHNTFDKLAGHCLLNGIPTVGTLLTTTGRVSGEMMCKALALGVAGVASYSGPTDVAISLARDADVMLVGYAGKREEATVYTVGAGAVWERAAADDDVCGGTVVG